MNNYPEGKLWIYVSGVWRPLCGHWFWDNDKGANTACRSMGYDSGTVSGTAKTVSSVNIAVDAWWPGKCGTDEPIGSCTRGTNTDSDSVRNTVGTGKCGAGTSSVVKISCVGNGIGLANLAGNQAADCIASG